MNNQSAVETLVQKLNEVKAEKNRAIEQFDKTISDLEISIEVLSGKKVWEVGDTIRYDDENPNYIKASLEEI